MLGRRTLGLSVFAVSLVAQACLVEACGGDDVTSSVGETEDASPDQSVHDSASTDATIPSDATTADASTPTDASIDDGAASTDASDASLTDASIDAAADSGIDAGPIDASLDGSADAAIDAGTEDAGVDSGADSGARYSHTIKIDGVNDFTTDETFATTSSGYTGYLAWDDTYLYVGVSGNDVGSGSSNEFFVVYLGGVAGTTTGVDYNTEQPGLPFAAKYHVRWKADNTFTDALAWDGSAWSEASWNFTGNVFQNGNYLEMRIPLVNIGSPTSVSVDLSFVNEASGVEATYSGVPSTAFADGYDRDFAKYLELGLQGEALPNASPVLP